MLAQFIVIDLFSLQKEYIDNRGANSGFESMVHLHNQSYGSVSSSIIVTIVAWHNTSKLRVWRNHLRHFTRIRQRGSVSLSPCGHTFYQFYFTSCINISVVQILNVLSNFKFAGALCELLRLFCVNLDSNATFHFCPDR